MKIKKKSGYVVFMPLSDVFQMIELGGSYMQKYDTLTGSYVPNRGITPFMIQPSLIISDPDNIMATADYAHHMRNVSWTLTLYTNGTASTLTPSASTYAVGSDHALTIYKNVAPTELLHVSFHGEFLDTRRNEVLKYDWERDITTEAQTNFTCTLDSGLWTSLVRLSPFKDRGEFAISVQMKYGDNDVPDADAAYIWEWRNETANVWSADFSEEPWYVSGATTKAITVEQEYIQNVLLRCRATAFNTQQTQQTFVTRLKRWYGQYEEEVEFRTGKYVFADSELVVLEGKVTNRQGNIAHISDYFDMELFFAIGNEDFKSVGYGEEAIIRSNELQNGSPRAGILCRELSAFQMLTTDDDEILCDEDGTPLFVQLPITTREIE